jgi:hypothetical protein
MSYEQKIDDAVQTEAETGRINWDDTSITSTYANIATATATREEFFLLFGIHQNWKGMPADGQLNVKLTQRVVLNPYAAKRLTKLLERSIAVYEERFGTIHI